MEFRPCIDIHNGKVKQIVGSSLRDEGDRAADNFVSGQDGAFYARLYQNSGIRGGHIILLNHADSPYYEADKQQALQALGAYPGGLQIGGGITADNAREFIEAGASHVIVTSYVFRDGRVDYERLEKLKAAVGKEHIVLDLSCRHRDDGYYIVTDRWQKFTDEQVTPELLDKLADYCSEYLIHAVDMEGKSSGIELPLAKLLGEWNRIPITYAGGVHSFDDLKLLQEIGKGKLNVTIGSALDLFGGSMKFEEVLEFCRDTATDEEEQMNHYTKEDILRIVEEEDVEFIRLQFTDIFGTMKNVAVTSSQLYKALDNRIMFDGSAIEGFARIEESDMFLYPDLNTFTIFPWRPQQGKVARIICDVYKADGTPFEGDPRYILKRQVDKAAAAGYTFNVGPECEFFLFQQDENGQPTTTTTEKAGYFDLGPIDQGENARRDMILTLEDMGFEIEASHHETAHAQHEIDFRYEDALTTADNIMTFKLAVKTIAKRHGLFASFMPKPKYGTSGSGMHINMSLSKDDKNIFEDPDDRLGLSQEAYWFIGGLMKHIKGMSVITNPLVNSYKRLVPGFEAPVYISWSATNRSPLIRIPAIRGKYTRIELRNPDPSANPYLVLAACLAAGLQGIEEKIDPPAEVRTNLFAMTEDELEEMGIEMIPSDLHQAVKGFKRDPFIQEVIGKHITEKYIEAKEKEWAEFRGRVTDWEISNYLYRI